MCSIYLIRMNSNSLTVYESYVSDVVLQKRLKKTKEIKTVDQGYSVKQTS